MSSRPAQWTEAHNGFDPHTAAGREELRAHLEHVLSSPAFHNSKRYAAVLRFIVEQTLDGEGPRLKERTLGVEVFQRAPDYDTANDHCVRSAVAEVRKRLAQYYLEAPHAPWRIEVPPGSYIPQFRRPAVAQAPGVPELRPSPAEVISHPVPPRLRTKWYWITGACVVALASIAFIIAALRPPDIFDVFWRPILSSRGPCCCASAIWKAGTACPAALLHRMHLSL